MKSVFRIRRKGKVKPIVLSTLQTPKDLDAKFSLIQALIQRCHLSACNAQAEWHKRENVVRLPP